jgi:hypothetical protein
MADQTANEEVPLTQKPNDFIHDAVNIASNDVRILLIDDFSIGNLGSSSYFQAGIGKKCEDAYALSHRLFISLQPILNLFQRELSP